jgi:hypothetical protein
MRLFDGEVEGEEARRLAAERRWDPSVDARLAGLLQVAEFTRVWASERGVRAPVLAPRRRAWALPFGLALGGAALSAVAIAVVLRMSTGAMVGGVSKASIRLPAAAVAVEQVDFGEQAGTIFSVPAAGTVTTVVWLSDDADESSLAL